MPVRSSGLALLAVAGVAIGMDLCGAQHERTGEGAGLGPVRIVGGSVGVTLFAGRGGLADESVMVTSFRLTSG